MGFGGYYMYNKCYSGVDKYIPNKVFLFVSSK